MGALERAAAGGHAACVERLLRAGALPDASPTGWTPLIRAVSEGHEACARLLLEGGADPKGPGPLGIGTGREAASKGFSGCLRLLLAAGSGVDFGATDGQSILGWAASGGHGECVKLLLEAGAPTTMKTHSSGSQEVAVSLYARATGHPEMAHLIDAWLLSQSEREALDQGAPDPAKRKAGPRV